MNENPFRFDCSRCPTPCDGVSKGTYIFENDVDYSERKERLIINQINTVNGFFAEKCEEPGYPDIKVFHEESGKIFYIEIKAQRRTFMSVKRILPDGNLIPSETLACNLSDFLRYVDIHKQTGNRIFVLWCLENRPCIVEEGKTRYFYEDIENLEQVYLYYGNTRRFRRESGHGDVVNGQHRGVVVNYHFSLNEFLEMHLLELLEKGIQ